MWPALRPGDRVRVRALASGESCLGKVVVCMHGERCHAHRVVELGNDLHGEPFVRCRGDDSPRLDGPVSTCDVIGEVVEVERHGRTVRVLRAASPISSLLAHVRPVLWRLRRRY
jgi:hypothetical protein